MNGLKIQVMVEERPGSKGLPWADTENLPPLEIPEEDVRRELHQGVPIIADGVSVSSADQGVFFSLMGDDELLAFSDQLSADDQERDDYHHSRYMEDDCA